MARGGFTLIELLIIVVIVAFLAGGIFLAYSSILDSATNSELRTAGVSVLTRAIEGIRNMPYDDIGVVGGVPAGAIPSAQAVTFGGVDFAVHASVFNIDDPFDGTIGGTPNDTSPADYKLVELRVECPSCTRFVSFSMTTTIAPRGVESATENGSLFVNIIDANGDPIAGSVVQISNTSTAPSINLTDTTNVSGTLQLVSIPTSTLAYAVNVGKPGYSSERTYAPGEPQNPNPVNRHATVAAQTVTGITFIIDRVSTLRVESKNNVCAPLAARDFTIQSAKRIGTLPDIYKLETDFTTDSGGVYVFSAIEWDTYALFMNSSDDVRGTIPLTPYTLTPNTSATISYILSPASPPSLLVILKDSATGAAIPDASVSLTAPGFSANALTGRASLGDTDWSGGNYTSHDGGVDTANPAGTLTLSGSPGAYPTSTAHWLVSRTFDVGSSSTAWYRILWNPETQAPQTGSDSVRFQIATNNDNATWNFVGPDGTASTYYASSGQGIAAAHAGTRYLRYKAYLMTEDENVTPTLGDVNVEFRSACVPLSHTLFTVLPLDDYTVTASAANYDAASTTVSVAGSWQQVELPLIHQ